MVYVRVLIDIFVGGTYDNATTFWPWWLYPLNQWVARRCSSYIYRHPQAAEMSSFWEEDRLERVAKVKARAQP